RRPERPRTYFRKWESATARQRSDCGDYQLHEHVESIGDAGRWTAGQEGGGARSRSPLDGQNGARSRIESCPRLSGKGRPDAVSGEAEVSHRGLRLHDVYWKLGPAAG